MQKISLVKRCGVWAALALAICAMGCDGDPPEVDSGPGIDSGPTDAGGSDPDAGPGGVTLPDTAAGRWLTWAFDHINNREAIEMAEYEARVDEELRPSLSFTGINAQFTETRAPGEPEILVERILLDEERWIQVIAIAPIGTRTFYNVFLDEDDPNPANFFSTGRARLPPLAADAAAGPDDIGMAVYDPYQGQLEEGATVELLDATTGAPLSPAVQGVTDADGYLVLSRPAGTTAVALRITLEDGTETDTFRTDGFASGFGAHGSFIPAFSAGALPFYLGGLSIDDDPTHGHVFGFVLENGRPFQFGTSVGCLSVAASPTAEVLYGTPPDFLADRAATATSPRNSNFYAFDLVPGSYDFTATDADGATTDLTVPALRPGTITVANFVLDAASDNGISTCLPEPSDVGCAAIESLASTAAAGRSANGVVIQNDTSGPVRISFVDTEGELRPYIQAIEPGDAGTLSWLEGDSMVATSMDGTCLGAITVTEDVHWVLR